MGAYKNLPLWGQFTVAGVFALAIFIVGFKVNPNIEAQRQTITQLKETLAKLKEDVRKARILAAKEPQLRREINELELKLEDLKMIIPPFRDDAQLLGKLKTLADRSSLGINGIKWGKMKDEEFYKRYPINMDVDGRFHDLAIFFDRLSRESRIFNVSQLKVSQQTRSSQGTIKATFTTTTFVFKEDDPNDGKKKAGQQNGPRS